MGNGRDYLICRNEAQTAAGVGKTYVGFGSDRANAVHAAFIISPGNHDDLAETLIAPDISRLTLTDSTATRNRRRGCRAARRISSTGDEVTLTQFGHPNPGFEAFFRAGLR